MARTDGGPNLGTPSEDSFDQPDRCAVHVIGSCKYLDDVQRFCRIVACPDNPRYFCIARKQNGDFR